MRDQDLINSRKRLRLKHKASFQLNVLLALLIYVNKIIRGLWTIPLQSLLSSEDKQNVSSSTVDMIRN